MPPGEFARRFLARGVQHAALPRRAAGQASGGLEQQGGLADPRLSAQEHERARDEASAEYTVEFTDAQAEPWQVGLGDVRQAGRFGNGVGVTQLTLDPRGLANDRLDQAVPFAARAALAFPAKERLGATLADEAALRPRHA